MENDGSLPKMPPMNDWLHEMFSQNKFLSSEQLLPLQKVLFLMYGHNRIDSGSPVTAEMVGDELEMPYSTSIKALNGLVSAGLLGSGSVYFAKRQTAADSETPLNRRKSEKTKSHKVFMISPAGIDYANSMYSGMKAYFESVGKVGKR